MERRAAGVLRPPRERVPRQAPSCPGRSSTLSQGSCTTSSTSGLVSRWNGRTGRWSGPNYRYLAGLGMRDGCGGGVPGRGWGGGAGTPLIRSSRPWETERNLPLRLGGRWSWRRLFLDPPAPFPAEACYPDLTGCAVRASLGQPFWLLVWRLRGLLRRRSARASGAWGRVPLCGRIRRGAIGHCAGSYLCLLRWRTRGEGLGWGFCHLAPDHPPVSDLA